MGLVQHAASADTKDNLQRTLAGIEDAAAQGANIICTQELFRSEYFCREQRPELFDLAEPVPGPSTNALSDLARRLGVVIIGSVFEQAASLVAYNSAVVIGADGQLMGVYRKMHIPQDPGFEEKFYFTPGDKGFQAYDTPWGRIGVLVCWDQWYPEAARLTALRGAEILFYPTAIGWLRGEGEELGHRQHQAWETVQRGHAIANGCYVCAVNRVGTEADTCFWGQSFISDPYGTIEARAAADQPQNIVVDIDLGRVREFRRIWPFFRDRRIDAYADLSQRTLI